MIAKMSKAKIFILEEDYSKVLKELQKNEIIMLDEKYLNVTGNTTLEDDYLLRTSKMIKILENYAVKKGFFEYDSITYESFANDSDDFVNKLKLLEDKYENMNLININIKEKIQKLKELMPFANLQIPTQEFSLTTYVDVCTGYINQKVMDEFLIELNKNDFIEYQLLSNSELGNAFVFVFEKKNRALVNNFLNNYSFKEIKLESFEQKLEDVIAIIDSDIKTLSAQVHFLEKELSEKSTYLHDLKILYDQMLNSKIRKTLGYDKTETSIYFEGWIKKTDEKRLDDIISKSTKVHTIEFKEPTKEDKVPTVTNNNKIVKNFESITNMYSVPNYYEVDPNPMMSAWYWVFFGMMMGDFGYGLLMVILCGLFLKLKKPKGGLKQLLSIFYYSGFSTMIAGILFGSFFGAEFDLLGIIGKVFNKEWTSIVVNPMNSPMPVLIFSIVIGAIHIMCGLGIKTLQGIRTKNIPLICSGLTWIFMLLGIGSFLVINKILAIVLIAIGILLLFYSTTAEKKGLAKLPAAFGGIYGATSYLSDLLSYSRLLALSLSSGVIAFTMNMLAAMLQGNAFGFVMSLLVYFVGHIFNFVMGMLSAYVHTGRLQYIEFFNKFFEGGGYEFKPLSIELKYLNNIEIDN